MAFKINADKYGFSQEPQKIEQGYSAKYTDESVSAEAERREAEDKRLEERINSIVETHTVDMEELETELKDACDELRKSVDGKQTVLTFDTEPLSGSSNPVTSDGVLKSINQVYSAIDDAILDLNVQNKLTFDARPVKDSPNPVTSAGIYDELSTKADKATTLAGYGIKNAYTMDETDELYRYNQQIPTAKGTVITRGKLYGGGVQFYCNKNGIRALKIQPKPGVSINSLSLRLYGDKHINPRVGSKMLKITNLTSSTRCHRFTYIQGFEAGKTYTFNAYVALGGESDVPITGRARVIIERGSPSSNTIAIETSKWSWQKINNRQWTKVSGTVAVTEGSTSSSNPSNKGFHIGVSIEDYSVESLLIDRYEVIDDETGVDILKGTQRDYNFEGTGKTIREEIKGTATYISSECVLYHATQNYDVVDASPEHPITEAYSIPPNYINQYIVEDGMRFLIFANDQSLTADDADIIVEYYSSCFDQESSTDLNSKKIVRFVMDNIKPHKIRMVHTQNAGVMRIQQNAMYFFWHTDKCTFTGYRSGEVNKSFQNVYILGWAGSIGDEIEGVTNARVDYANGFFCGADNNPLTMLTSINSHMPLIARKGDDTYYCEVSYPAGANIIVATMV